MTHARIAGGRGRVVAVPRGSENFREDRFQVVGPNLVRLGRQVQPVVHHARPKISLRVGEFVVDVYVTYGLPVRELRDAQVGVVDDGVDVAVVVARRDAGDDDGGLRRALAELSYDGRDAT